MTAPTSTETTLVGQLNDLLKLDHDALGAYEVAINALRSEAYQRSLRRFRGDHERHVQELTRLISERGGTPIETPHLTTGLFKLAMQKAGAAGGSDRSILLAFKANERQVRDKYQRMAEAAEDLEAADILARGADDETRHYGWVVATLEELGVSSDSPLGRVERVVEVANARFADVTERMERGAMSAAQGAKRLAKRKDVGGLIAVVAAVGLGVLASRLTRSRR